MDTMQIDVQEVRRRRMKHAMPEQWNMSQQCF
jgi:hypothetical protein